jgi:hypothetical protein
MLHQKFLYGLKPLPSGRFLLDARQSRVYLSGNPFLQGEGQSTRLLSAGVALSGGQSRMWIETLCKSASFLDNYPGTA